MAKTSTRKLFLFGRYSLALLPPKKWLSEMGIKEGDQVHLEFDRSRRRIVVRLDVPAENKPTTTKEMTNPPNSPEGDWQPIPQL